jgi:hypothetical protein
LDDGTFSGDDLDSSWALHFRLITTAKKKIVDLILINLNHRLSDEAKSYLSLVGVVFVYDLLFFCPDLNLMNELKNKINPIEFNRFLLSLPKTTVLSNLTVHLNISTSVPSSGYSKFFEVLI